MLHYKQTTRYTCAACSLMMIINHFNEEFYLSKENEFNIWQQTVALPTRGSNIFALGIFAHKQGVKTKVIVEKPEYKFPEYELRGYNEKEIEAAAFSSLNYREKAKRMGVEIEERNFTVDEIKELIAKQNKILLLRLNIGILRDSKLNRTVTHYLPVYGIEGANFLVMDPKKGKMEINSERFESAFKAVKKQCKKDNRVIIFG